MWPQSDSNTQPFDLESNALPLRHEVYTLNHLFLMIDFSCNEVYTFHSHWNIMYLKNLFWISYHEVYTFNYIFWLYNFRVMRSTHLIIYFDYTLFVVMRSTHFIQIEILFMYLKIYIEYPVMRSTHLIIFFDCTIFVSHEVYTYLLVVI